MAAGDTGLNTTRNSKPAAASSDWPSLAIEPSAAQQWRNGDHCQRLSRTYTRRQVDNR